MDKGWYFILWVRSFWNSGKYFSFSWRTYQLIVFVGGVKILKIMGRTLAVSIITQEIHRCCCCTVYRAVMHDGTQHSSSNLQVLTGKSWLITYVHTPSHVIGRCTRNCSAGHFWRVPVQSSLLRWSSVCARGKSLSSSLGPMQMFCGVINGFCLARACAQEIWKNKHVCGLYC